MLTLWTLSLPCSLDYFQLNLIPETKNKNYYFLILYNKSLLNVLLPYIDMKNLFLYKGTNYEKIT